MIKIVISCLIINLVKGENCALTDTQIEEIKNSFSEAEAEIKNNVTNERAAIFLGNAKSGKSTLINYLIGNKLIAQKDYYNVFRIKRIDNEIHGPKIGTYLSSETKLTSRYKSNKFPNLSLWDTPGFDDNRGEVQDINNSFYIYQLIKNVKSLKIVLVFDFHGIENERVDEFVKLLKSVEEIFGRDFEKLFASVSIIFTKVGNTSQKLKRNSTDIVRILKYNILEPSMDPNGIKISYFGKHFLKFLIDNTNHIGIFRISEHEGIINSSDIDVNIINSIRNSRSVKRRCLQNVQTSISTKSLNCLHSASNRLQSLDVFIKFQNTVKEIFENIINLFNSTAQMSSDEELEILKSNLTVHKDLIETVLINDNFHEKINILQGVSYGITKDVEKYDLMKKITQLQFIDKLLKKNESVVLEIGIKAILYGSQMRMKTLISEIDYQLNIINLEMLDKKKKAIKIEYSNITEQLNNSIRNFPEIEKSNKFFKNLISLVNLLSEVLKKP